MARQMVCIYGMSDKVGLAQCAVRENMFLPDQGGRLDCSEATAHLIDEEVKQLLDTAYQAALQILNTHREQLDAIARRLLETESLDGATFQSMLA